MSVEDSFSQFHAVTYTQLYKYLPDIFKLLTSTANSLDTKKLYKAAHEIWVVMQPTIIVYVSDCAALTQSLLSLNNECMLSLRNCYDIM